jgi:ADP-heptose:LPS heptosyltransferase
MDLKWPEKYPFVAKTPIGSLAKYYRTSDKDFSEKPYIKVNDEVKTRIGERVKALGNKMKIGISWQGGAVNTNRKERTIPLHLWTDLLGFDADFISLQYDKDAEHEVLQSGLNIHHWPDILTNTDYEETAGLVANLDLVISVPQSVVHLAGAMGIPTWQLCPYNHMWQMGVYGEDMPWYQSVKNIWQDSTCRWESVLETTKERLCGLSAKNIAA